jgi:hypothetical protein
MLTLKIKTLFQNTYLFCYRYLQTCLLQGLEKEQNTEPAENEDANLKTTLGRDKSDMLMEVFESGAAGKRFEARMVECFDALLDHLQI